MNTERDPEIALQVVLEQFRALNIAKPTLDDVRAAARLTDEGVKLCEALDDSARAKAVETVFQTILARAVRAVGMSWTDVVRQLRFGEGP